MMMYRAATPNFHDMTPDEACDDLDYIVALLESGDASEVLRGRVSESFYAGMRETYGSEQSPRFDPWQALSPRYAKWKEKHHPGRQILELTGEMKATATGNDPQMIVDLRTITWYVDQAYAPFHEFGTSRMPARPFFGATDQTQQIMGEVIAESFAEAIG